MSDSILGFGELLAAMQVDVLPSDQRDFSELGGSFKIANVFPVRQAIESQLNKVELANSFTRAVAVGNPGYCAHSCANIR